MRIVYTFFFLFCFEGLLRHLARLRSKSVQSHASDESDDDETSIPDGAPPTRQKTKFGIQKIPHGAFLSDTPILPFGWSGFVEK